MFVSFINFGSWKKIKLPALPAFAPKNEIFIYSFYIMFSENINYSLRSIFNVLLCDKWKKKYNCVYYYIRVIYWQTSYVKNVAINTIYVSEYSNVHFELKRLVNTKRILIKHMTLSYSLFVIKETSFISSFNWNINVLTKKFPLPINVAQSILK